METSRSQFPAKEQAIVLTSIKDLKLTDYVVAIGDIVTPKNVVFASRMSNERICIYLSDVSNVDQIISERSAITIQDKRIAVRRLINPARKIIFSNVCPSIPHSILEDLVKSIGFTTLSQMSFLRAAIGNNKYNHVLSFGRQTYIQPNETLDLASSLVLKYDNTNCRIFLSYDNVCFKCKMSGHFANDCPGVSLLSFESDQQPETVPEIMGKRQAPEEDVPIENPLDLSGRFLENSDDSDNRRQAKKIRSSDSTESLTPVLELFEPAKELLDNAQYPISFSQTVEFMEKAVGENIISANNNC
ncbi:hypothetical protein Zmor_003634 [Zophobas morio]|uniref:CCHC-type domain-containing protein n=1 Tax=Zophobas morio TaxID=2755281 RepID=A0AA38M2U1_9CUCU|nr:hypothetical protein Zmor_003634 [Zophobas morio]